MSDDPQLFGDPLMDYQNGVRMDLRLKLAIEFLKADLSPLSNGVPSLTRSARVNTAVALTAVGRAAYALDLAGALIEQASARSWLKELPETAELSARERRHVERQVRTQLEQQLCGQRVVSEEAPKVQRAKGVLK